jgi:uncharacterized protein
MQAGKTKFDVPSKDTYDYAIRTSISDKRRSLEILAVVLTAAGKFLFMDFLHWRLAFIIAAIGGWTLYVILENKNNPAILRYWGFRTNNVAEVTRRILPFGVVSILSFVVTGLYLNTINPSWHILPVLVLYPLWGIVQQFLVIALFGGNLQELLRNKSSSWIVIVITALLFGFLHFPYYWLIGGTFVLALLYGYIYSKARNIYVMGIFHGWLGALFFYTVVDRDPFMEIFGTLL